MYLTGIRLKRLAEQVLFAFNIFIAFLIIFEDKLVIPVWLQPVGRMHPLILHFPIVLLMIAMLLEFFRFRNETASNPFYNNFLKSFLLAGALFSAITVVMGLFLSNETGYNGDTLNWHKWTGVAIFFSSSFIYWVRDKKWYRLSVGRIGAVITVAGLILTGHYGATLTHGENFIMEPISKDVKTAAVPLEQALLFDHVIIPILEQKCVSCHNPNKLKGELKLSDETGLLKGGKSGKLFVAGNPEMSLLLQRVYLPDGDKKKMPPTGKTQLTVDEIHLLELWIAGHADFKGKVMALPKENNLRTLAISRLAPIEKKEEKYDFSPANSKTVAKLNNDYRTIALLARESSALSVNVYNSSSYTVKQLDELEEIKKQVVTLNLHKLPIKDEDLKRVAKLENLRRLDLNFTGVTAIGLKHLVELRYLHTLTLAGTQVDFKGLDSQLPTLKALRSVALWQTGIKREEFVSLQEKYKHITFNGGFPED